LKNLRILISGAGVAGLALAYWLRRHGFVPTVVERSSGWRAGGHKIDVRGAAVDVIERMGILSDVERASVTMVGASWVDGAGKRLVSMDAAFFEQRDSHSLEILRGDLTRILGTCLRDRGDRADGVESVFDDAITGISENADGVAVTFERSAPRSFDLVVGADGVHSGVRALTFGAEARFVHDLGGYHVATFTVPNRWKLDRWDLFYLLPGKTMNVSSVREDADARAVFLFSAPGLKYGRRDRDGQRKLVADVFAHVAWELPWLLELMKDARDFYLDDVSQVRMDRWSSGRAVLVGDAGYAPSLASGQGTSLALVGAYVLAGELKAAAGDHVVAFSRYEAKMRGFVAKNQRLGTDGVRVMVLPSRWKIWLMIWMLRLTPYMPWKGWLSRRIKFVVDRAANAIALEAYEEA
jgi:2-polyprenyl-6-methoxyphenol hydroxylase-like FAD-dependent oxidoreductase